MQNDPPSSSSRGRVPCVDDPLGCRFVPDRLALPGACPVPAHAGKLSWLDEVVQEVIAEARAGGQDAGHGRSTATAGRGPRRRAAVRWRTRPTRGWSSSSAGPTTWPGPAGGSSSRPRRCSRRGSPGSCGTTPRPSAPSRPCAGREAAGRRDGRDRPAARPPLSRRGRDDGPPARAPRGSRPSASSATTWPRSSSRKGPRAWACSARPAGGAGRSSPEQVLPHKKKLAAAGVLAAFLADPDKFVDYAGQATEYAVREFARAGIQLAWPSAAACAAGPRSVDRRGPRRPRPRLRRLPLCRHGPGRAGRGAGAAGDPRAAGPLAAPAVPAGRCGYSVSREDADGSRPARTEDPHGERRFGP